MLISIYLMIRNFLIYQINTYDDMDQSWLKTTNLLAVASPQKRMRLLAAAKLGGIKCLAVTPQWLLQFSKSIKCSLRKKRLKEWHNGMDMFSLLNLACSPVRQICYWKRQSQSHILIHANLYLHCWGRCGSAWAAVLRCYQSLRSAPAAADIHSHHTLDANSSMDSTLRQAVQQNETYCR